MIIVLNTSGKCGDVDYVKIKLFTNLTDAKKYCEENTDNPMDNKYWNYCAIIEEDTTYEIARYINYNVNT